VYKQLLQKDVQSLENKTGKKQLSGYKQCYIIYKNQSLEVSKYMILLSLSAKKSILVAKPPNFSKVVYAPELYNTQVEEKPKTGKARSTYHVNDTRRSKGGGGGGVYIN